MFRSQFEESRERFIDGFVQIRRLFDFDINYPSGKVLSGAGLGAGAYLCRNTIRSLPHVHLTFLAVSSNDRSKPSLTSFVRMMPSPACTFFWGLRLVCWLVQMEAGNKLALPAGNKLALPAGNKLALPAGKSCSGLNLAVPQNALK
ncbi:hypothetical protein [Arthrobacter sp. NA-172]|uniref:hypothetical protein n=1 Tax=Arthrobacter sp. NA-172 TaxID=3367524 RepID=UPI0037548BD1